MPTPRRWFPIALLAAYSALFLALSIHPYERAVWWGREHSDRWASPQRSACSTLRGVRVSNLAYALMSVLLFLHTVGGYFTFERVPFEWVTQAFGFHRNHYDRIAHFSVGFYAFGASPRF